MPRKTIPLLIALCGLFVCPPVMAVEMTGARFAISAAVISAGGGPATGSDGTTANSTLGQSSPLTDGNGLFRPPRSDHFILSPGFWYAGGAVPPLTCFGDLEPDYDVDGLDLAGYALAADFTGIDGFAASFGRLCP